MKQRQRPITGQGAESNTFWTLNPKYYVSIKSLPSEHRKLCKRRGGNILNQVGTEDTKETRISEHNRTDTRELTETVEHAQDLQRSKSYEASLLRGEGKSRLCYVI